MAFVGHTSLVLAVAAALASGILLAWGGARRSEPMVENGVRAVNVLFGLVALASLALWAALLGNDFSIRYVEATSRINQPGLYKIGAFWSGQEGSFLLWLLLLTGYMAASARWARRAAPDLMPYALAVQSLIALFFALMTAFVASPFETFPAGEAPPDGRGLTPLLRDPGMMGHPLFLFLGYVGLSVPFSFALATLLERKSGSDWLRVTRPWTMTAWLFLTLGIVLGGWWAYRELGWGGFWAWDPVENASFMPWLVATAFFHSAMVEERRGLLRSWNTLLIIAAFILTILGTFIVRSGILQSVHAFAASDIGPWFMGFIGLLLAGCLYLVWDRFDVLTERGRMESAFSKEGSFLLNNLILVGLGLTVLVGTVFPLLTRLRGIEVTVGPPFFNKWSGPLFTLLLLLMAVCPLLAWRRAAGAQFRRLVARPALAALLVVAVLAAAGVRKPGALMGIASGTFVMLTVLYEFFNAARARARATGRNALLGFVTLMNRNPRRYGGYLVHLGIALMGIAVITFNHYQQTVEVGGVAEGQSFRVGAYTVTFQGVGAALIENEVESYFAPMAVRRGGREVGMLRPELRVYPGWEFMGPMTEADTLSTPAGDLYVVLAGFDATGKIATFKAWWNPMVPWLWIGAVIILFGTTFALWPRRPTAAAGEVRAREERLLAELGELEYDYRMGKIPEAEYAALREELTRLLAEVMKEDGKD